MKVLSLPRGDIFGGAAVLMSRLVTTAHVGCIGEKLRYDFSHMISMASFHVLMFSRLSPPSLRGNSRVFNAMWGVCLPSHMKSCINFCIANSILFGIP